MSRPDSALQSLRAEIRRIEAGSRAAAAALPFGLTEIDSRLPGGGLALGALHEVTEGRDSALDGAGAALFVAGIVARTRGRILWCLTRQDLFAPALVQAGLVADRVVYVEAGDEKTVLACCEDGLRHGGLGAVVGEMTQLSMTASRRLQLAAESSGTIGLVLRRRRRRVDAFDQPTAAVTRWRITALPSAPLPVPGIGRARWRLELVRCRAGESAAFIVEACDAQGCLAFPADLAHRPVETRSERSGAVA